MKQTSDTQNNELINRLLENVTSKNVEEPVEKNSGATANMPSDQLLEMLRLQMGSSSVSTENDDPSANDYDISGFEIEDQTEDEISDEVYTDAEQEISTTSTPEEDASQNAPADEALQAEDDVPWEVDNEPSAEIVQVETVTESTEPNVESAEEPLPDEFDLSLEEADESQEQEALKKQIELFVEKTIDPDEVFDYFEGLEKKSARMKKSDEEMSATKTSEAVSDIDEPKAVIGSADASVLISTEDLSNEEPCTTPEATRFFFCREASLPEPSEACEETKAIDDTDINLLLALGQKRSLEQSIGFVRVREAKNNFYDPTDEESLGNHIFAYNGEEFRDPQQADEIKTRYRKEKKDLWLRFAGTVVLGLAALFVELLHSSKALSTILGAILARETNYRLISLLLLLGGMLISSKRIIDGVRGFFTMRANRFTPLAMIALTNLLYEAITLLFFKEQTASFYTFALLALLALSIVGDAIRLTKETLTFDIVSSPKEKYALEKADPAPEMSREERILSKRDLLVENVSFVGKYFARTARRSAANTEYFIEYLVSIVIASFVAIGAAAIQKELSVALNAFNATLLIAMPMQYLIGSYPFGRLSKILYRHESAVIGEAVDREYVGANTVYLDDTEVFGLHGVSVSGLRTYNEANFYEVLYHSFAVFSRMEGPLQHVFDNSAEEIEPAKDVELIKIHANGIEALVDNQASVLIGNAAFMKSKNMRPKQTEEDEQKIENGEASILYMAVDGVLCAKFYMKYNITKRFETFVSEMHDNATSVGVRTLDPGVSEEMIARLRKGKDIAVSVVRPTLNDLIPIGRRSDSSIITAKNSHMIARILALCGRVKRINRLCTLLRIGAMVLSLAAICILLFTGLLTRIPSVLIVIYHLLWLIPSIAYTATKLK